MIKRVFFQRGFNCKCSTDFFFVAALQSWNIFKIGKYRIQQLKWSKKGLVVSRYWEFQVTIILLLKGFKIFAHETYFYTTFHISYLSHFNFQSAETTHSPSAKPVIMQEMHRTQSIGRSVFIRSYQAWLLSIINVAFNFNHDYVVLITWLCITSVSYNQHMELSLHKKRSFPLKIWSARNCGFGHIYWRNPFFNYNL